MTPLLRVSPNEHFGSEKKLSHPVSFVHPLLRHDSSQNRHREEGQPPPGPQVHRMSPRRGQNPSQAPPLPTPPHFCSRAPRPQVWAPLRVCGPHSPPAPRGRDSPRGAVRVLAGPPLPCLLRRLTWGGPTCKLSPRVQTEQLGIDGVCREINQRRLAAVPAAAWARSILMNPELPP